MKRFEVERRVKERQGGAPGAASAATAPERELGAHVADWSQVQVFTVGELVEAVLANVGGLGPGRRALAWEELLAAETDDPDALNVTRPRPVADLFWRLVFKAAYAVARACYGLKVSGLEKLPASGPFILAPNHQSYLDAPVPTA